MTNHLGWRAIGAVIAIAAAAGFIGGAILLGWEIDRTARGWRATRHWRSIS